MDLLKPIIFLVLATAIAGAGGAAMNNNERKAALTPLQYQVTQECGTEPPFHNAYWDNKRPGIYVDIVSGEPLFSSLDKFESGTGWPSFVRPLESENIVSKTDKALGMIRTEVRSKAGNSHLGHVFNDGPAPTGTRFCINSASLRFIPAADLEKEGYAKYLSLFNTKTVKGASSMDKYETATFAAGCFWGVEWAFKQVKGVIATKVGYTGGTTANPTYQQVCTNTTGHAEAVEVTFDPAVVSFDRLLDFFWKMHDPTTLNSQGPDFGTQYRSAVFYHSEAQKSAAAKSKQKTEQLKLFQNPIVTEIVQAPVFYPAEEYHQDYFGKHPDKQACHIMPKKW